MTRHKEAPSGRSGRSSRRKKKQQPTPTNRTNNGRERTNEDKGRGNGFQRFDEPRLERVSSNTPTMAIAPSDYEHIYHDDVHANAAIQPTTNISSPPLPSPAMPSPPPPRLMVPPVNTQTRSERAQISPSPNPLPLLPATPNENEYTATTQRQFDTTDDTMQVSPDGYTLLGHRPDPNRRVALPPYIVRANNQFSRAVLARVARYLSSRAEGMHR